ncbi:MAG: hypothetical protein JWN41_1736 [Thermoleophilia bacterium]|nr:hypothetical protein [Thermoleophilia bacterium]
MPTYETPVNAPAGVPGDTGLSTSPVGRPAIMPLHPRFAEGIDVCAVLRSGAVEFVARDVFIACGLELDADLTADRGHEAPLSFTEHATARTWSRALIGDILTAVNHLDVVREFLFWLDNHITELNILGLATHERRVLYGNGHRPTDVLPKAVKAAPPAFYSVAAAARILSRDPGIGKIGRDTLFMKMQDRGWINRTNTTWEPAPESFALGYFAIQKVAVLAKDQAYPQILITPLGIEALHKRLGGTTTLQFQPADHLTLIEATHE